MSTKAMKLALEKIARVNACDYEYQAWAREALNHSENNLDMVKQEQDMSKIGCVNHDCDKCKEQGEPVAWMRQDGRRVTTASNRHNYPDYETRYSIPLYTTPQQPVIDKSAAIRIATTLGWEPKRKPLTDEQTIIDILNKHFECVDDEYVKRAAKEIAAHGIKE